MTGIAFDPTAAVGLEITSVDLPVEAAVQPERPTAINTTTIFMLTFITKTLAVSGRYEAPVTSHR